MKCTFCDRVAEDIGEPHAVGYDHVEHTHCLVCAGAVMPDMEECLWCGAPAPLKVPDTNRKI